MNRANRTAIAPWIIILIFAAFSIRAQQAKNPQSEQKPSLEEAETWIKQTFTDDNVGSSDCQEYDPERPGVNYGPYAS